METNRKCVRSILAVIMLSVFFASTAAFAQDDDAAIEQKLPVKQRVATNCAGEVDLSGSIVGQFRIKPDGSGGFRVEADFGYGGLSGVAVRSKDEYRAAGTSHFDSTGQLPMGFDYVANFALNKPGSKDSLMGHIKLRIDLRTKDEVIATVREVEIGCRK